MGDIDRILLVPRWGGTPHTAWYPWLTTRVRTPSIQIVPLPEPDAPKIDACAAALSAALRAGDPARTLCVGHSVSVQAWLHALEAAEVRVAGLLGVAGWQSIDDPWPTIRPWLDATLDLDILRARCGRAHVLLGTNDPFTADQEANADRWRSDLGAHVTLVDGAEHFNREEEPAVQEALTAILTRASSEVA